jgi:hypothetical protein
MVRGSRTPALAALLIVSLFAAAGCGKRGSPKPPLPKGPHPPGKVDARQLGRRAIVEFVVPQPKGARPSQQPVRAELLRVTYQPGFQPPDDPDALRRRGDVVDEIVADPLWSGQRLFLEDLRLDELTDGGVGYTLRYAVRVRDRRGRSSPLVIARDLELLASAPAPRNVRAEPSADGVRVLWDPPAAEGSLTYNVYRSQAQEAWERAPLNRQPLAATEFLDRSVTTGERYTYSVRIALSSERPYREGEPGATAELLAEDRFAPGAPTGLVAVQEGAAVRLFWDPNPERDVAGYRVERRPEGGQWSPIGPERIETPSFLDSGLRVGARVHYRIRAIDRAEPVNVSEPSEIFEVELVAEPVAPGPAE